MDTKANAKSPFKKLDFSNSSKKARETRHENFLFMSSFIRFHYFVLNILPANYWAQANFWFQLLPVSFQFQFFDIF